MPNSTTLEIQLPQETGFSGYCAQPTSGEHAGIVLIQEIFGVNHSIRTVADQLAQSNYVVLAPDLFFRFKPNVQLGYTGSDLEQAFEYYHRYNVTQGVSDLKAAIATLRKHPRCNGKVALMGFCLGGKLAYLTAADSNADAAVAFYGGGIAEHLDLSAHIRCPLLMHFGAEDEMIPKEQVERIKAAFKNRLDVEIYSYPDAGHAFYNFARPNYVASAAELAEKRTMTFLKKALG